MVTTTGTVCPADLLELERKVGKAKALLILDRPFYGMYRHSTDSRYVRCWSNVPEPRLVR